MKKNRTQIFLIYLISTLMMQFGYKKREVTQSYTEPGESFTEQARKNQFIFSLCLFCAALGDFFD